MVKFVILVKILIKINSNYRMNKEKDFYHYIYNNKSYFYGLEAERINQILKRVPSKGSILEVGCGDGRLLNRINADFKIGVDFSIKPLIHIKNMVFAANASNLPFSNNSFDVLICSEVLEHLDNTTYNKTLDELLRVSSRYILISVPYKENLNKRTAKCKKCNRFFNVSLHYRAFDEAIFENLFPESNIILIEKFGYRNIFPYNFDKLKRITGNYFIKKEIICPHCGIKDPCKRNNLIGKLLNLMLIIIRKIFFFHKKKKPIWILAIFEKKKHQVIKNFKIEDILVCPLCYKRFIIKDNIVRCIGGHKFYYIDKILDLRV